MNNENVLQAKTSWKFLKNRADFANEVVRAAHQNRAKRGGLDYVHVNGRIEDLGWQGGAKYYRFTASFTERYNGKDNQYLKDVIYNCGGQYEEREIDEKEHIERNLELIMGDIMKINPVLKTELRGGVLSVESIFHTSERNEI